MIAAQTHWMRRLCAPDGRSFWPDQVCFFGDDVIGVSELRTPTQVTDSHPLALAASRSAKLATFDRKLSVRTVHGGRGALHLIDGMAPH